MEQKIAHQVKVYFEEEIRRFTFSGYSFVNLVTEIKRIFNFEEGETLTVQYQDEDKDLVLVTSDEELRTAKAVSGSLLKLHISSSVRQRMETTTTIVSNHQESAEPQKHKEKKDWKEIRKHVKEFKTKFHAQLVKGEGFYETPTIVPATKFSKTWKIRNESEENWPEGCTLTFQKGEMMEGPKSIPVPQVAPGREVTLSVTITSPAAPGRYLGVWRLTAPFGENEHKKFGPPLKVKILVSDASSSGKNIVESSSDSSSEEEELESKKRESRRHGKKAFKKRPKLDDLNPLLSQLEKMGFEDKEENLKLLNRAHGNLDIVVKKLLKKNESKKLRE